VDEAAFVSLYDATRPALRAYVAKCVGDASIASDITQEAYVRLLQARVRITDARELKAYLYRIATNLVHDHWRRRARETRHAATPTPAAAGAHPDTALDVRAAFDRLSPNERNLLWLAYVEGYDHQEIARISSVKPMSVRVLLFRARQKLLGLLGRAQPGREDP
jgi:RNA polymerase sigma-70 factor (ECF subfamily)